MELTLLKYLHEEGLELLLAFRHSRIKEPISLIIYESPETRGFNIPEFKVDGVSVEQAINRLVEIAPTVTNLKVKSAIETAWKRTYEELREAAPVT